MSYPGIDYGLGLSNVDKDTGIRYGVIPMNSLNEWAYDSFESDYGAPHCPKCGNEAVAGDSDIPTEVWDDCELSEDDRESADRDTLGYEFLHHACGDYACDSCRILFDGEDAYGDEAIGYTLDDGEYQATAGTDGDCFLLKSPYFTYAQFCSPCAPGAGYLLNPCANGPKTYCFGPEWFEDNNLPYPVYSVATGELVKAADWVEEE